MRKWRLPLTYQPKIEPVLLGTCRQTIRIRTKNKKTGKLSPRKEVGDLIRFFLWSGRPYWSKQIDLTEYEPLKEALDIRIFPDGFVREHLPNHDGQIIPWRSTDAESLAVLDGIVPPTGAALHDVLISKNGKIPAEGLEAQILRW